MGNRFNIYINGGYNSLCDGLVVLLLLLLVGQ